METAVKSRNGRASKKELEATIKPGANANGKLNGVSKTAKAEVKTEVKEVLKPEMKPTEQVKPAETPKPELTLEQKIEKVQNLKTLIEKREKLEESRKKLSSFVVGTNQFNESIVLTGENGNTFKTSNSEVFAKVVQTINTTLVEKIQEIEQQIEF